MGGLCLTIRIKCGVPAGLCPVGCAMNLIYERKQKLK